MRHKLIDRPIFHHSNTKFEKKASWLELFYDLMYVASFIQLGNIFSKNMNMTSFLTSCLIFLTFWVSWSGFTFFSNRYNIDDVVHRFFVFFHMFTIASLTVLLPSVFAGDLVLFSILFGVSQFIVAIMYYRVSLQNDFGIKYTQFWGKAFFISAVVWSLASLTPATIMPYFWLVGISVILIAPLLKSARELAGKFPFDHEHLSERYGLLTIIVLGESFVKVLSELVELKTGSGLIFQACFSLLLACSIWWIYFDDVADSHLKKSDTSMPIWLLSHIPLQLAIVFMGVGIKKITTADLSIPLYSKYAILLSFSIAVILLFVGLIDYVTHKKDTQIKNNTRVILRIASGIFCLFVGLTSQSFSALFFMIFLFTVVIAQILIDLLFSPYITSSVEQEELSIEQSKKIETHRNLEPIRKGLPSDLRNDIYYTFINSSWPTVLSLLFIFYIISNIFFAFLYLLAGNITHEMVMSFKDAFFFSVQTMSTIGYGVLAPVGSVANIIVTVEAAFGLVSMALMTGVIFNKISRPNSKIMYSTNFIVSKFDGQKCLSFRLANARGNDLLEASVKVSVLKDEVSLEGNHIRRIYDLDLKRSTTPFFKQSWSVFHPLVEGSPLLDGDKVVCNFESMIVTLTGHDGVYSNTVYSRHAYYPEDIIYDRYFADIMQTLSNGRTLIDYGKFDQIN